MEKLTHLKQRTVCLKWFREVKAAVFPAAADGVVIVAEAEESDVFNRGSCRRS